MVINQKQNEHVGGDYQSFQKKKPKENAFELSAPSWLCIARIYLKVN